MHHTFASPRNGPPQPLQLVSLLAQSPEVAQPLIKAGGLESLLPVLKLELPQQQLPQHKVSDEGKDGDNADEEDEEEDPDSINQRMRPEENGLVAVVSEVVAGVDALLCFPETAPKVSCYVRVTFLMFGFDLLLGLLCRFWQSRLFEIVPSSSLTLFPCVRLSLMVHRCSR